MHAFKSIHKFVTFIIVGMACAGLNANAQQATQWVLDTAVSVNGTLPGYHASGGGNVLRTVHQGALSHRWFLPDGTAERSIRYDAPDANWAPGAILADEGGGAVICGAPSLAPATGGGEQWLAFDLMSLDAIGLPVWSIRIMMAVGSEVDAAYETRLLNGTNGSIWVVVVQEGAGPSMLRVLRVAANGVLGTALGIGGVDVLPAVPWGSTSTLSCSDEQGGIVVLNKLIGENFLIMARVDASGELTWVRRWTAATPYLFELRDLTVDAQGELILLGRMGAAGLPSGGMIARFDSDGEPQRVDRYQWDIGQQLVPMPDGGFLTHERPWTYRIDPSGQVLWARFQQDWNVDEFRYIADLDHVELFQGVLRLNGALRKVHMPSNTQRVMPLFATYDPDDFVGCRIGAESGFGFTAMGPDVLADQPSDLPTLQQLMTVVAVVPLSVIATEFQLQPVADMCELITGVDDLELAPITGFELVSNMIMEGTHIELQQVLPGTIRLFDPSGRMLMAQVISAHQERLLITPPTTAGMMLLHWVASDAQQASSEKVLVH